MNLEQIYQELGKIHRDLTSMYFREERAFFTNIIRIESILQEHKLHPQNSHIAKNKSALIDAVEEYFGRENELSRQENYWPARKSAIESSTIPPENFPLGLIEVPYGMARATQDMRSLDLLLQDQLTAANQRVIELLGGRRIEDQQYFDDEVKKEINPVLSHVLAVWCHGSIDKYAQKILPFSLPQLPEIIVEKFGERMNEIVREEYVKLFTFQGEQLMKPTYDEEKRKSF